MQAWEFFQAEDVFDYYFCFHDIGFVYFYFLRARERVGWLNGAMSQEY
jgi:hypothetical protein